MGDQAKKPGKRIRDLLPLGYSAYRGYVVHLAFAVVVAGGLAWAENVVLEAFTESFAREPGGPWLPQSWSAPGAWMAVAPPVALLVLFVLARSAKVGVALWHRWAAHRVRSKARGDLEAAVFSRLLRKDDLYYAERSPRETMWSLSYDAGMVSGRRGAIADLATAAAVVAGTLFYFAQEHLGLAIIGATACAAGAWWMDRTRRAVLEGETELSDADFRIREDLEDLLRLSPEIQINDAHDKAVRRVGALLAPRSIISKRVFRLGSLTQVVDGSSFLLAFAGVSAVVIFGFEGSAALIPVVLKSVKELFEAAANIVEPAGVLRHADECKERLLDLDREDELLGPAGDSPEASPVSEPIRVSGASWTYPNTGEGGGGAGVEDVSAELPLGSWTAIVGGAGSGKSTLARLLLGRIAPRAGSVTIGTRAVSALTAHERAERMALLPQETVLIDGSIIENLFLDPPGKPDPNTPTKDDLFVIEASGLGAVCRTRALDGRPEEDPAIGGRIVALRPRVREALAKIGVAFVPYETRVAETSAWAVEVLLHGRCDRAHALDRILSPAGARVAREISRTPAGRVMAERGKQILAANRGLLKLANGDSYNRLASVRIDPRVWRLRCVALPLADSTRVPQRRDAERLVRIALCGAAAELPRSPQPPALDRSSLERLRALLGNSFQEFVPSALHPFLSWRENLLFAAVESRNGRQVAAVDRALLGALSEAGLDESFTRLGLRVHVGRHGRPLTPAEKRLIGLCRTLQRRTPVVILDDPGGGLDPEGRARVRRMLRAWASEGRVVVTLGQDPAECREADQLLVLDGGRIVTRGRYQDLVPSRKEVSP